jgi:hypothetical protein
MCIDWLQDGLDLFHRDFPWTGIIGRHPITFSAGQDTYALPNDYTLDVHNGVRIMQTSPPVKRRLPKRSLSYRLNRDTTTDQKGVPKFYTVLTPNLVIWPYPDRDYNGELWYYKLPAKLAPNDRANFPDDWTLIQYVSLCGKEWTKEGEPGTAMVYARKIIGELLKTRIGVEADSDEIELDSSAFGRPSSASNTDMNNWMGDAVIQSG